MSDDGELPESEGELVDSDGDGENNAPVDKEHAYTLFNKSNFNQSKPTTNVNDQIDDADFDPYSDYQPKKSESKKDDKVSSESDEGEVADAVEEPVQEKQQVWDIPSKAKPTNRKRGRHDRHEREENADFLSQLDAYNSFKDDGANSTKRRKSTRVHIKDKNRYHDFDTPDGPMIPSHHHTPKQRNSTNKRKMEQRNNDSDVGSDFSSDGEQSGFKNKYILSDNSNDSMDENPASERRTRPRIVDGRKKSPSRAKGGNRSENNRRQKNAKNDRGSNRKNEKRDKKSEKAASVERESRQSKKTEVCKYYLAQSCLKADRCHYMHASYPCKRFHFSGSCYRRDKCIFSHATPPTTQIQKILDRLRAEYWMPDDTKEIEALEAAGVQLLPKPPQGIPLLKTPPPSVLCEPMSGKYLEFSGPREMCPLPGETYPHLAVYRVIVSEQQREMTDNFILDFISDKELAEVDDVQEHADPTVGLPFDDIDGDPEEIGWILAEWKRNNHMPLDETILAKTPDFRSNSQSPRVKPELGVEEDQFDKGSDEWDPKNRLYTPPPGSAPPIASQAPGEDYYRDDQYRFDQEYSGGDSRQQRDRDFYSPQRSNSRMDRQRDEYGFDVRYDDPRDYDQRHDAWDPRSSSSSNTNADHHNHNGAAPSRRYDDFESYRQNGTPEPRDPRSAAAAAASTAAPTRDSSTSRDYDERRSSGSTTPTRSYNDDPRVPAYSDDSRGGFSEKSDYNGALDEASSSKPVITLRRESVTSQPPLSEHEPRTETQLIADQENRALLDPRKIVAKMGPLDLPIPDMIDFVDFRVTFTINGQPYIQPADDPMINDTYQKLPMNLPTLSLPRLSVPTTPVVSDPRRRSTSTASTTSSINNTMNTSSIETHVEPAVAASSFVIPTSSVLSPTSSKKKISLSDYLNKKTEAPSSQKEDNNKAVPILSSFRYGSGD